MARSSAYVMGGNLSEQQRLVAQAASLDREARWLLDRLGVQPGWRVADLGCGPIGILDRLAERVGPQGRVVGVEREPRFLAMAEAVVAERGLTNVELIGADATATGLPGDAFDLVHERLTLLQQPDPRPMLREMARLTRPGGVVAVQDIDDVSWVCEPPHPAWSRLLEAFRAVCQAHGMDVHLGRRLPGLLRDAGLVEVEAEAHVRVERPGSHRRMHLLALAGGVRERIVALGLLREDEVADLLAAVQQHLEDPATVVISELLCQAWGRRPG